jgi:acetylornithine deacetylase/succinyl-diaminopimelate desuccinylase-like protein
MTADYYKLLKEYLNFKSISTNNNFSKDIQNCANRLKDLFIQNNFKVEIINKYWNPIIIASYISNNNLDIWLIYGHYDVQDADQKDGWSEDPFTLYIKKDKIIWRWVADNKWQTLIHIISILKLIKEDKLWYNVTFILEWEEEIWSNWLIKLITQEPNKINADFVLVSDGNIIKEYPVIENWFRWWFNANLEITTANTDLHTWIYGWIAPNPIEEMNKLLAKIYDTNNQITIPYFYYEVEDLNSNQKTLNSKIPFDEDEFKNNFNLKWIKLKDIDFYSKTWRKPCIEITWISWWNTNFFKNSIPNKATANINFRLVNNQKCDSIMSLFEKRIKNNLPQYLDFKISFDSCCKAIKLDTENYFANKAEEILTNVFNKKVFYIKSGWSLPIISTFQEYISNKILSIPLANDNCNMHWVNENLQTDLIEKWLEFSYKFFQK